MQLEDALDIVRWPRLWQSAAENSLATLPDRDQRTNKFIDRPSSHALNPHDFKSHGPS